MTPHDAVQCQRVMGLLCVPPKFQESFSCEASFSMSWCVSVMRQVSAMGMLWWVDVIKASSVGLKDGLCNVWEFMSLMSQDDPVASL